MPGNPSHFFAFQEILLYSVFCILYFVSQSLESCFFAACLVSHLRLYLIFIPISPFVFVAYMTFSFRLYTLLSLLVIPNLAFLVGLECGHSVGSCSGSALESGIGFRRGKG